VLVYPWKILKLFSTNDHLALLLLWYIDVRFVANESAARVLTEKKNAWRFACGIFILCFPWIYFFSHLIHV
jgi:hypothetical protein